MNKISTLFLMTSVLASAPAFSFSAWDKKNNPDNFEWDYEMTYSKLPKKGELTEMPWSGDYWPTYKGGITYRWNDKAASDEKKYSYDLIKDLKDLKEGDIKKMSPAEKYDLYLGRSEFPLTNYERKRTNILKTVEGSESFDKDFKIPTWEGLCHAWAPATVLYSNPEPVTVVGKEGHKIEFGSSDIKALLTYHLHLAKAPRTRFLGSRCNMEFGKIYKDLQNNSLYENKVSILIEKVKEFKKTLIDTLSLNEESELAFSWEKKKTLLDVFNKLSSEKEDVEKLNEILKKEILKLEDKTFLKTMIEKKLTMATELEGKMNRSECKDTNAGAFHVVITNQIANMDESFVVDVTRDSEVWNQAVQGFDVKELEVREPSEGSAEGTVKEVVVETKMHYIVEIHHTWDKISPKNQITTKTYRYKLELDKNDKIIGGDWITLDRPDFIWKNGLSEFKGIFEDLGKIYKKSTSYKKKMSSASLLNDRKKLEEEKKELEKRITKFEEDKKKAKSENEKEAKRLAEEFDKIEDQRKLIEKEKASLDQLLEIEKEKLEKKLEANNKTLNEELAKLKEQENKLTNDATKAKEKLEKQIQDNKDSVAKELAKLKEQIRSNAKALEDEISKLSSKKESLSLEAKKLESDKLAFETLKKEKELEFSKKMEQVKKAQEKMAKIRSDFAKKQAEEKKKLLKQRENIKSQMKKLSDKRAKFQKERLAFKKEVANFEKEKNVGITKDLIKDLKVKIDSQNKVVKVSLVALNNSKKKVAAAHKAFKKLRGSIFNRNYKRLKNTYKASVSNQELKEKEFKSAKQNLKRLRVQLREATNRLRVASSN